MHDAHYDLSARSRARVIVGTLLGTLGCVLAALYLDSYNFRSLATPDRDRAIIFDVIVPTVIAAPLFFYFLNKLRELAVANHAMAIIASTDSLTGLLNRGAFIALAESCLSRRGTDDRESRGALLVVDADNFKTINDRFGHECGDDALKLIADAIRKTARVTDHVGRLGGEEFGIFLPGSSPMHAEYLAERIRLAIAGINFAPRDTPVALSVSVGCASFATGLPFKDLFRVADRKLYEAKDMGRNQVAASLVGPEDRLAA